MADSKLVGAFGVIGIAVALIAPESIDRAEAEKRIAEATCITAVAYDKTIEVKEAINEVDTITKEVTYKMPSEHAYRPLYYIQPTDTFEVTVRKITGDTTMFIGRFASDTSALLDVSVRLQPSNLPEAAKPTEEVIEEVK